MNKKNIVLLLLSSSLLISCGVHDEPSSKNSEDPSDPTSSSPLSALWTIDAVKEAIEATAFKGYSFEENGNEKIQGSVTIGTNGILYRGKATFEEESVENAFLYRGYDEETKIYYDIENFRSVKAERKRIVITPANDNEITEAKAKENILQASYNASYIKEALAPFFASNAATKILSENEKGDAVTISLDSYLGGTTTMNGSLVFDKETKELSSFEVKRSVWSSDEWDQDAKAPLDPSGKPLSKSEKKATIEKGEETALSFDTTPYFITSIPNVYLSSYDDVKANAGKAEAGKTIHMEFDSYLPSTALNENDIKVVSSSDPSVIDIGVLGLPEAKKPGTCELTISDSFASFSKKVTMEVVSPAITALYLYADKKEMEPNETMSLRAEIYSAASTDPIEAISSDPSVISIESISSDRLSISIKALNYGTSNITIRTLDGKIVSKPVTITVKDKEETPEEYAWLIGTWQGDDDIYETVFTFSADHKGTFKQGSATPREIEWAYEPSTNALSFPKWPSACRITAEKISVYYTKTRFTIRWDDPYEDDSISETFTKVA